jgi:UPF0755 protein
MTIRPHYIAACLIACLVLAIGAVVLLRLPNYAVAAPASSGALPATPGPQTVTIQINEGDSAVDIANRLRSAGVIQNADLFDELASLQGLQNGLAAGQYEFNRNLPAAEVLARLHSGGVGALRVTIPEGKRLEEVAAILDKAGVVSAQSFMDAVNGGHYSNDFLHDNPQGNGLEGYIFPDTYNFPAHNKPEDVVNLMLKDFGQRLTPDLRAAYQQEGLSIHSAVTIASIVEREAQDPTEAPIIASVFLNRIRLGMPLQADPTVQFALTGDPKNVTANGLWKSQLTLDDLTVDSIYNTYIHTGLPPGPITNPGLNSLQAVAHPAQTNFLFFVAKDGGTHVFAATYAEHQANIAKYQH